MYISEDVKFETTGDFELGFEKVTRETNYHIVTPEIDSKGLVVYIPGYGDDASDSYRQKFCQSIAEKHQLSVMTVDYHSIFSRADSGAVRSFERADLFQIRNLSYKYQVATQSSNINEILAAVNERLVQLGTTEQVRMTGTPKKNEYQNGGIMSAVDIINAVNDALNRWNIPKDNIILIGSSYGGYLANLAAKLAPNTFRAVFDNSSWAKPYLGYIVGREVNFAEWHEWLLSNILLCESTRSCWTLQEGLPTTFNNNRIAVRSFGKEQLEQYASYKPTTQYYCIHAFEDEVADTSEKIAMVTEMLEHGIDTHMIVIEESDIDGSYIKTIKHGLGLSMQQFFDHGYQHIEQTKPLNNQPFETNFDQNSIIRYQSDQLDYVLDYSKVPVQGSVLSAS